MKKTNLVVHEKFKNTDEKTKKEILQKAVENYIKIKIRIIMPQKEV